MEIPESVVSAMRLPGPEVEARLKVELAVALFAQWILSFGKAAELAGVDRYAFAELVGERGVARHYTERELAEDLRYASSR